MMQPTRKQSFQSMKSIENVFRRGTGLERLTISMNDVDQTILAIHWTHEANDRQGVDAILEHSGCRTSKVDFKFRRKTEIAEWIILETFSKVDQGLKGWASRPSKADDFVFVQFYPNGFISQIFSVKAKAINDLLNHRYDDLLSSGVVRRSGSTGSNGNQWQGEFVAITPQTLMTLLNPSDYRFFDFLEQARKEGAL